MNKLEKRALMCILFIFFLVGGMGYFTYKLIKDGGAWVSYPANDHVYTNGKMTKGTIYDRNGELLVQNTESGIPEFNESSSLRRANLHVTGDAGNNIGTGANTAFGGILVGYDLINGVYSRENQGEEINLTVDAYGNLAAYEALGSRSGTVLVYNYKTGEILVSVSTPTFDPKYPDEEEIKEGAYLNKGLSSAVVPGSIFKVVTATAAIETIPTIEEFEYTCTGELSYGGDDKVTCPSVHGTVDFDEALAKSCNGAFAILSEEIGADTLEDYTEKAGLTDSYSIDGIKTKEGSFEFPDEGLNLAWAGIGQYNDLVNPLSMMVYMGAIANGGEAVVPKILLSTGEEKKLNDKIDTVDMIESSTANRLDIMLKNDVESYGTWNFPGLNVAGKTGSAEVEEDELANAWFAGYLDDPEHPYAFIVLVERGGTGGGVAIPVANEVLQSLVD